ncbi:MAG: radical SAM family heme chaperone HemW [Candidatus Eisenbacteria bacterium]|nr:radical SAM family heme chaperone HemW [Candidatus Eisenbacteria bacterium]
MVTPATARAERLALYIHVPFCRRRCSYCDFYSETDAGDLMPRYLDAVCAEWRAVVAQELGGRRPRLETIYFGGGTPSLLPPEELARLFEAIAGRAELAGDAEITLEANPESVDSRRARLWREAGFNRVSLGVQSLDDGELHHLGRVHTAAQAEEAVHVLRRAGFANLGCDFIYGVHPGGSAAYRRSLRTALAWRPEHVAAYMLALEESTPLAAAVRKGAWRTAAEDDCVADYRWTVDHLQEHGYEAYEISNFARAGYRSRHNERYWGREPYVGLGPGAHSLRAGERWSNPPDLAAYIRAMARGDRRGLVQRQHLSPLQVVEERLFLGLRRSEGVSWSATVAGVPDPPAERLEQARDRLAAAGFLTRKGDRVAVSPGARFVSNAVIVELLAALDRNLSNAALRAAPPA